MSDLNDYLSPSDMESQEHLDIETLKSFIVKRSNENLTERPSANYIDLMNWVSDNFGCKLKNNKDLEKFVQNRIIIDGPFVQFCRENKVTIECLYKDAIISWKSDHGFEKFFVQGVFIIRQGDLEFIHAALFHKGNQNEDEVSFFILVTHNNYNKYVKFRNEFDNWSQKRDRGSLYVRVMQGEDIPYNKNLTWDDLYLPADLKKEVIDSVEGFLMSKEFYEEHKLPWKRGMLLYGTPGCHQKGTNILMYDGSFKKVEDINVGDILMGPDSKPREVLKLVRGNDLMYKIIPNKGKEFVVNSDHILHLKYSLKNKNIPQYLNITVNEYLNLSKCMREKLKLVKSLRFLSRKKELARESNKDSLFVGIKDIVRCGYDNYYGFIVDCDHLYVMDDFWVTHNCGKTTIIKIVMSMYDFKPITVVPEANADAVREAFSYAQDVSPALLYFEDLGSLLEKHLDLSTFLNLMDGVATNNGLLVVATTNEIEKLKDSISDRPSRFDRKFEIPLPNYDLAYIYLKRWFGKMLTANKYKYLAKLAVDNRFSFDYLKEFYISSMFEALANKRSSPNSKDVEIALKKVMKDKSISKGVKINLDRYIKLNK